MPKAKKNPAGKRGRQPDASSKSGQIRELLKTGMSPMDIAKKVGSTPALVYNVKARLAGPTKRGPGRPAGKGKAKAGAKRSAAGQVEGLDGILTAFKSLERERAELRSALEKMQTILSGLV